MPDDLQPHQQDLLFAFLKDRDVPCPRCQYNLRNLAINACPECGKAIELAVKAIDVSVQSWATFTVALSLPAGVGILFLHMWFVGELPPGSYIHPAVTFSCMAALPVAIAALALRQPFLRMSRDAQFYLAALAVCFTVVLFFFLLRSLG